ncbi:flagellar hook-associated family protein [uncultured Cohaesibacter sp.]|uniref:flagellar hook-associated family protein n=1 Tax=uncultured Cohaesibacter sp. TaxID=1002546 RepID=UPI0029C672B7|nr:flagellar hook-associated family protein [uncultured Cohaesibacter sp.]
MTNYVSTLSLSTATKNSIALQTSNLVKLEKESASGRKYDVGLDLGSATGQAVSVRAQFHTLNAIVDTNALISSSLDVSVKALENVSSSASEFQSTLLTSIGSGTARSVVVSSAQGYLDEIISTLNTSFNGSFIFAGINTEETPVVEYETGSSSKTAIDASFSATFGFAPDDPNVANITAADIEAYLDGDFADQFNDANWSANWSSATDQVTSSRISATDVIDTSASANEDSLRQLAMAYTMMSSIGAENMSQQAFDVVATRASELIGGAIQGLNNVIGKLGNAQARVSDASDRIAIQTDTLNERIIDLENVDASETAVRLSNALTQLELTYSITSRMQNLSLLNYL